MGNWIYLLVTVFYESGQNLTRAAIALNRETMDQELADQLEWFGEPKTLEMVHALLPLHVRNMGPVVQVEQIFCIETDDKGESEAERLRKALRTVLTADNIEAAKESARIEIERHIEQDA